MYSTGNMYIRIYEAGKRNDQTYYTKCTYALQNAMYSATLVLFGAREAGCGERHIDSVCVHVTMSYAQ